MRRLSPAGLLLISLGSAFAQSSCPPTPFTAVTANLKPDATSHIDLIRQSSGSYLAFQVTDASPYTVLATIANFQQQFGSCVPLAAGPKTSPSPIPNQVGAGSQLEVSTVISNGAYFVAHISNDQYTLYFDLFDSGHHLLSENDFVSAFDTPGSAGFSNDSFLSLALADVNGDGQLDLVAAFANSHMANFPMCGVWVFLGNGDGTFRPGVRQVLGIGGEALLLFRYFAIGDLNGDEKLDLLLCQPLTGAFGTALGNGDGTFTATALPSIGLITSTAASVALADLNGDGKLDVVSGPIANPQSQSQFVTVSLGNGDGTFQAGVQYPVANPVSAVLSGGQAYLFAAAIAIGDVNGDAIPDIVTAKGTVLLGDGHGGFPTRHDYSLNGVTGSVMLFDFDGDGKTDVVFGNGSPNFLSGSPSNPAMIVMFGQGQPPQPALSIVSAATYVPGAFAANSIATIFGTNLAPLSFQPTGELPTAIQGLSIEVQDALSVNRFAPLFFVSPTQVNFLIPPQTSLGTATIKVNGTPSRTPSLQAQIVPLAPSLFTVGANIAAAYAVQVSPAGVQTIVSVYSVQSGNIVANPIDLSQPGQVFLTLFGTGFDSATAGLLYAGAATTTGLALPVTFASPAPNSPGLDQVNLLLPKSLAGAGTIDLSIGTTSSVSNSVAITIK